MSEKKCPTCEDSGYLCVNCESPMEFPKKSQYGKCPNCKKMIDPEPCPDCTKPEINTAMDWNDFEQIEGISEVMSKSVAKRLTVQKPDEDKISLIRMEGAVHRFDMLQDKDRLYKEGHHDGYKSAISDSEKEIEELKKHNKSLSDRLDLLQRSNERMLTVEFPKKDSMLDKAVEVLEFINEECDWEEFSGGDRRIGKVILKALTEIQEGRL